MNTNMSLKLSAYGSLKRDEPSMEHIARLRELFHDTLIREYTGELQHLQPRGRGVDLETKYAEVNCTADEYYRTPEEERMGQVFTNHGVRFVIKVRKVNKSTGAWDQVLVEGSQPASLDSSGGGYAGASAGVGQELNSLASLASGGSKLESGMSGSGTTGTGTRSSKQASLQAGSKSNKTVVPREKVRLGFKCGSVRREFYDGQSFDGRFAENVKNGLGCWTYVEEVDQCYGPYRRGTPKYPEASFQPVLKNPCRSLGATRTFTVRSQYQDDYQVSPDELVVEKNGDVVPADHVCYHPINVRSAHMLPLRPDSMELSVIRATAMQDQKP